MWSLTKIQLSNCSAPGCETPRLSGSHFCAVHRIEKPTERLSIVVSKMRAANDRLATYLARKPVR